MSKFRSYKEFNGYSTAFRQWRADSHCQFIHGYALKFKVWFEGDLDHRNWVVDFGCFKRNGVDTFNLMDRSGLIQLRIMEDVGCEKFAEFVFNYLNQKIVKETDGRVNVYKVQCWEHSENMAEYYGK